VGLEVTVVITVNRGAAVERLKGRSEANCGADRGEVRAGSSVASRCQNDAWFRKARRSSTGICSFGAKTTTFGPRLTIKYD